MGVPGPQGPAAPVAPVSSLEADVASLLASENEYRLGLGQTALSAGLSCRLYTATGGDRIQSSIAGHNTLTGLSQVASYTFVGVFNQPNSPISDGMNVLPPALRAVYKNMYMLRCEGQIVVTKTDYYLFELTSDDASLLYVGGSKVIDNDNNHGSVTVSGMKYLRRGVHAFRVDYAQMGGGSQSLMLKVDGAFINPLLYAH
jgi:hypothetical protein